MTMVRVFLAFIVLLGAVYLGIQLHKDAGYVLIVLHHFRIETTVWVAILGILLASLLSYLLLKLACQLIKAPKALYQWRKRSLRHKAKAWTEKGLIEYNKGEWLQAKRHLVQGIPNSANPLINYLTAAQCAQKIGDDALSDRYLNDALQFPDAELAVGLSKAQFELANHAWDEARKTLNTLQNLAPQHPYVLKLLMHFDEAVNNWEHLLSLLPALKKNPLVSQEEWHQVQLSTYSKAIQSLGEQDLEMLRTFFNALPKPLTQAPQLVAQYVRILLQKNDYKTSETVLRRCLRKELNAELIELYGLLPGGQSEFRFAESLLKHKPSSPELYLCLGRLCLSQHLWGKAKYYLEQSLELRPCPKTHYELAKLYDKLNDSAQAFTQYKSGLSLASTDPNKGVHS